jgi:3-deoxy-D-manno-octulosonic-acid transferase
VAPLIEDALGLKKKIELVFFSPSVEKTIMKLAYNHPDQIRYLRYPFLRIFPGVQRRCFSSWVTAKTLVLVRYDLFPEFLLWSMNPSHCLKMVWVSFKKERSKGQGPSMWKKFFLKQAKTVVYAGALDGETGSMLGYPGPVYDFRMEQIRRRVELKEEKLTQHFPLYSNLKSFLGTEEKKIIFGNAWPSDLFLLRDLPKDLVVMVVPHKLSQDILLEFHQKLKDLGREPVEINDTTSVLSTSSTLILNKKGVLCELYADFHLAYVGGGFEGSIHSILEPLVAGSLKIACGPAHHRSTEYDIAHFCGAISEIKTPEQFVDWIKEEKYFSGRDRIASLTQNYQKMRELVLSC